MEAEGLKTGWASAEVGPDLAAELGADAPFAATPSFTAAATSAAAAADAPSAS